MLHPDFQFLPHICTNSSPKTYPGCTPHTLSRVPPSPRYQVWLEAYLKNGKKRVSEVQEFVTKPGEIGKAEEIKGDEKGQCREAAFESIVESLSIVCYQIAIDGMLVDQHDVCKCDPE